ncbi:hypothetical protein ACFC1R_27675 [Kitasatospora sp. NPDC056138]|uniref:hypothetical protein n=1 Tax=Kitasatospora sp. NPDC056138 TaxID=3345724 RepID=UPI0035DD38FD
MELKLAACGPEDLRVGFGGACIAGDGDMLQRAGETDVLQKPLSYRSVRPAVEQGFPHMTDAQETVARAIVSGRW